MSKLLLCKTAILFTALLSGCFSATLEDRASSVFPGMSREQVYKIMGRPINTDDGVVAVWNGEGVNVGLRWDKCVYSNGYFVIFDLNKCLAAPLKTTESDPISEIRNRHNISEKQAKELIAEMEVNNKK